MPAVPVALRWQRFLRLSARGMIVFVLVFGVWLGRLVRTRRIQREAVEAITAAGGGVSYDWEWINEVSVRVGDPWAPSWLVTLIGVDYFGHLTSADLSWCSTGNTDAAMVKIARLTRLQELNLNESSVSDAGLAHLTGLGSLTWLRVDDTEVSDAGLVHLERLTTLSPTFPRAHPRHRCWNRRAEADSAEPEDHPLN